MSTFDPNVPCKVHDRLHDRAFFWHTRHAEAYRQYARLASDNGQAIVHFDGLILDGWTTA